MDTRIFISYRREDTAPYAGRIYDRLALDFGEEHVFFDIDTLLPGDDFVNVLSEKVESCDVLLAVIGKSWLTISDAAGLPRIRNPEDYVVIEIAAALRRDVRVIPILVAGGRVPASAELPEVLAPLARRQGFELPDKGFIAALETLFPLLKKSRVAPLQAGARRINPKDGLTYLWCPPGKFSMSSSSESTASAAHGENVLPEMTIARGFWIGESPVTNGAYERVMGEDAKSVGSPHQELPRAFVKWDEALAYCQATGMRLPTKSEWQYARHLGILANEKNDSKNRLPQSLALFDGMMRNPREWLADSPDRLRSGPVGPSELSTEQHSTVILHPGSHLPEFSLSSDPGAHGCYPIVGFRCAANDF